MESTKTTKLKKQTVAAILVLALGFMVLTYGIIVEDEPTAVALLLIVTGAAWSFILRIRLRALKKLNEQKTSN